ncbi:MAG: DUF1501 domain-containing protein, partial [Verrucomicrobiae bacterium]|nr:DUF1501 domain-containing protein [Verrucomicrobiae bacterium]
MNSLFRHESNRRLFLANAAKTLLGVGAAPAFLQGLPGTARAALGPDLGLPDRENPAKSVIYLYMSGGMTHLDTLDPKPGHENQGPVTAIRTKADGIQISEYLPRLANHMDKAAVIRSMTSTAGAHAQGNYYMHTSYEMRSTIRHPGIGAWLLKYRGKLNENLPGSVCIAGGSRIIGGAGFFEGAFEPLAIGDPESGLRNSQMAAGLTEDRFDSRLSLSADLDREFREQYDLKRVRAYASMYDDAVRIMNSEDLEVFQLDKESAETRANYGESSFGQGCLLARRLVERNVRAVEVNLGGWDTHNSNFLAVPEKAELLDQGISALLTDLEDRGLLDQTLVVLATEFGRTPKINQNEGR